MSKSASTKSDPSMKKNQKSDSNQPRLGRKTKFIVGAGAAILVLGGVIIASRPQAVTSKPEAIELQAPGPASSTSRLAAMRTKFDFGSISMAGGKVTHRYPIRNTGTQPIVVRKIYTSCMCTTAALVKDGKTSDAYGMPGHTPIPTIDIPINSKDQASIEVIFDPAAHGPAGIGPIQRVVTIENNAGEPLELEFAANVTP